MDGEEQPAYRGAERRSGRERRESRDPQPPPGERERRISTRRKADRLALEGRLRVGAIGAGGRVFRRVRMELPVVYRPLEAGVLHQPANRGQTVDLAPGGVAILLDEAFPIGTSMEVLVRFEGDLLAADVEVVRVTPQSNQYLHNCRFSQMGAADRRWLTEYLRRREAPHP